MLIDWGRVGYELLIKGLLYLARLVRSFYSFFCMERTWEGSLSCLMFNTCTKTS